MHYNRMVRHGDPLVVKYQNAPPSGNAPCIMEGCDKPFFSRQMCPMHYQRWRKHGDAALGASAFPVGCSVTDCGKSHYAHGWCSAHFTRNKRHGSPTARLQGEVVNGHKIAASASAIFLPSGSGPNAVSAERAQRNTFTLAAPCSLRSHPIITARMKCSRGTHGYANSAWNPWTSHSDGRTARAQALTTSFRCPSAELTR